MILSNGNSCVPVYIEGKSNKLVNFISPVQYNYFFLYECIKIRHACIHEKLTRPLYICANDAIEYFN